MRKTGLSRKISRLWRYFFFIQFLAISRCVIPEQQAVRECQLVTRSVIPAKQAVREYPVVTRHDTAAVFFHDLDLHLQRYPELQAEDVYKFCYQAFFGIGHLISDKDQALRWLQAETEELGEPWAGDTLLIEPMGATYVRLHLHPYLRYQGSLEKLAEAMLQSLSTGVDSLRFQDAWSEILNLSLKEDWRGPAYDDLAKLTQTLKSQNFPIIHHNKQTNTMYRFHYRILSLTAAQDLLKSQAIDVRSNRKQ